MGAAANEVLEGKSDNASGGPSVSQNSGFGFELNPLGGNNGLFREILLAFLTLVDYNLALLVLSSFFVANGVLAMLVSDPVIGNDQKSVGMLISPAVCCRASLLFSTESPGWRK